MQVARAEPREMDRDALIARCAPPRARAAPAAPAAPARGTAAAPAAPAAAAPAAATAAAAAPVAAEKPLEMRAMMTRALADAMQADERLLYLGEANPTPNPNPS